MMKYTILAIALISLPLAAQDSSKSADTSKIIYYSGQQIETDIRKAPANDIGESEINLIERTPQHAAILLRRTKPGKAEVHTTEADAWYVIDGGCVLTTGGSVIDGKEVRPGQIQGTGISGGTDYKLGKGDFMRIPPGVPHWVKSITGGELVYIVVKYTDK
jgi:mannose-6-phosphate isomerase-like protein (cupin superfamily)